MFNLGLFELLLFGVIALIVLGPDKLIVMARTLGRWYGKFRRLSARLQSEFVSELELNKLQQELQAELNDIRRSEAHLKSELTKLQHHLNQSTNQAPSEPTRPLHHHFFLLGDYDKKRRLPSAPFLPNHKADKLLQG